MWTAILAEMIKLRRSLVLLPFLGAPACVIAFAALFLTLGGGVMPWHVFLQEGLVTWAYFLLPLTLAAISVLLAQMEHGQGMWNHLLVLPLPRWQIFAAKAAVMALLLVAMQALVFGALILTGLALENLVPGVDVTGPIIADELGLAMAAMSIASLGSLILQLWAALRFRSFVPPLLVGIVGTFCGLVITASRKAIYFPWLLQIYALDWPDTQAQMAVLVGLGCGILFGIAMLYDLSRRQYG